MFALVVNFKQTEKKNPFYRTLNSYIKPFYPKTIYLKWTPLKYLKFEKAGFGLAAYHWNSLSCFHRHH